MHSTPLLSGAGESGRDPWLRAGGLLKWCARQGGLKRRPPCLALPSPRSENLKSGTFYFAKKRNFLLRVDNTLVHSGRNHDGSALVIPREALSSGNQVRLRSTR